MLVRQKVITATIITCIAIVILATVSYITAADRIGREQLGPEISRSFAEIFQLQLQQNPDDIQSLQALANSMVRHYLIQEVALYNTNNNRIIYACSNICTRSLPVKLDNIQHITDSQFIYELNNPNNERYLNLIIESNIILPQFFYADTLSTTLLIVTISTLLLFFLYNSIRFWQRQPYQNLLTTIKTIQSAPDQKTRFTLDDADTEKLSQELNQLIIVNEDRESILTREKEKAESARIRAIRLSNETRQINEKLAQEITIRKSVETQLTHTRSFLDNIIDSMPSALFTLDQNGFIIQCNQQAADWLAEERHPLVGKRLANYIDQLEILNDLLLESLEQNSVKKIERLRLSLPIGDFPADITVYPLKDDTLKGLVIRIDDISQREKMEEVIMQTEKMKSVGGLAAGMAHEINNPLGAILQGVQNIQRRLNIQSAVNQQVADDKQLDLPAMEQYLEQRQIYKFINNIQDAGQRAASIVSNMLQFSRGNQQQLSETLVKELIDRTLTIARADLDLKSIDIDLTSIEEEKTLYCIPSEIEQVILNLLQNAAQALSDYQPPEQTPWAPKIELDVHQDSSNTYIKVKDNGPGMNAETRRRIFEPFFTTKDIGLGTGLGLSVSYFIITAHHHGQLDIESSPNEGACFTIRLPNEPYTKKS